MVGIPFNPLGPSADAESLSPQFRVRLGVGGDDLSEDIAGLVTKLEYDSADGMADAAKIEISNPNLEFGDLKIFQPGNEIAIAFGYGSDIEHIGRVLIRRIRYNYPVEGMASFSVEGYTRDVLMMDDSPEKGNDRVHPDDKLSDIVKKVAGRDAYKFKLDVDDTPDTADARAQIGGVSDYQMVKGCANLSGYFFWVDGEEDGTWNLHFKSPSKVLDAQSSPSFEFPYNAGQETTLYSFQPELLIQGAKTKLKVIFKDPKTGKVEEVDVEEPSPAFGLDVLAIPSLGGGQTDKVEEGHISAADIKVVASDFSFELDTNQKFKTVAQAAAFAAQWFRRHREGFITGKGIVVGTPSLRARQIHTLSGISSSLDGKWYFSRVRHVFSASGGYVCEFDARKQDSVE